MFNGRQVVSTIALALSFLAMTTAQADSGLYIGGSIGNANIEDGAGNPGGADFSESDTAWKAFVGYNLDLIPLVKLAIEGGYRDMGQPSGSVAGVSAEYQLTGFDAAVLAGVGLGPVDLFAKVGGMQYELEKRVGGLQNDYDGTAPLYGIGVWFTISGFGLRAEYEIVDIDELDTAEMFSIGASYKF